MPNIYFNKDSILVAYCTKVNRNIQEKDTITKYKCISSLGQYEKLRKHWELKQILH